MNIGQASRASGVSAKMIRYYEQTGLLPPAGRTGSGYRVYTAADVHKLRFVRRARDLGFSVAEVADLLALWNDRSRQSADVKRVAQQRIGELRERMHDLQQMLDTLQTLVDSCAATSGRIARSWPGWSGGKKAQSNPGRAPERWRGAATAPADRLSRSNHRNRSKNDPDRLPLPRRR